MINQEPRTFATLLNATTLDEALTVEDAFDALPILQILLMRRPRKIDKRMHTIFGGRVQYSSERCEKGHWGLTMNTTEPAEKTVSGNCIDPSVWETQTNDDARITKLF